MSPRLFSAGAPDDDGAAGSATATAWPSGSASGAAGSFFLAGDGAARFGGIPAGGDAGSVLLPVAMLSDGQQQPDFLVRLLLRT
eukprot:COSAG04_NODE_832_length_10009_cov_5.848940_7_plen_84_part_00